MAKPRFHRKSRSGCVDCKARRVKCDETKPICQRCQRTNRECVYEVPGKRAAPRRSLCTVDPTNAVEVDEVDEHDGFSPTDLNLMAHYTTSTALELFPSPDAQHFWQVDLPIEAQCQPHLMHGILALAATHLARKLQMQDPSEANREKVVKFRSRALHHQQRGLSMFQEFLSGQRAGSSMQHLFIFSTMLIMSTAAYMLIDDESPTLNDFLGLFALFRGAKELFKMQGQDFCDSGIKASFYPRETSTPTSAHCVSLQMIKSFAGMQEHSTCRDAAYELLKAHRVYKTSQFDIRAVGFWPSMLSNEFYNMLKYPDPAALAVLARYSYTLASYRHWWWIGGLGEMLLLAIDDVMDKGDKLLIGWDLKNLQTQYASLSH